MARYDLVIKNGTVIDGTGMPRYVADVAVAGGKIERIGTISASEGRKVIEAGGLIVAPGVIDSHNHFDTQIHWDPYCTPQSWHGCTSFVATNCGFGFAPCKPEMRDRYMYMMEATEQVSYTAAKAALPWDWETYPEFIAHMKRVPKGVNLAQYFPLNPAFCYVMGVDDAKKRAATKAEMTQLKDMLNRAMDAGAIGFSLSHLLDTSSHRDADLTPMPTDVHPPEDFYKLAEVLRERGEGLIQAIVDFPGINKREVTKELAKVSRRTILHNSLGPFDGEPDFHRGIMAWLDQCQDEGLDIYSFSTGRSDLIMDGNLQENNSMEATEYFREFARATPDEKARMAADPAWLSGAKAAFDPEMMNAMSFSFVGMILSSAGPTENRFTKYKGQTLEQIAAAENSTVLDVFFRAVAESGAMADFRALSIKNSYEALREVWAHPRVICGGTDGGAHLRMVTIGDSPSQILGKICREMKLITHEQFHYKMSGLVAKVFGFKGRGTLEEGYAADLMIYDPNRINTTGEVERTFDMPDGGYRKTIRGVGMKAVIVNGQIIHDDDRTTGNLPGILIGNGRTPIDHLPAPPEAVAAE